MGTASSALGTGGSTLGSWYVSGIIDGQLVSTRWDPEHER